MEWIQRFVRAGAVWSHPGRGPHAAYLLSSHHADWYLNTDKIVADPGLRRETAAALAPWAASADWIVAPVSAVAAGLILATAVAEERRARVSYFDLRTRTLAGPIPAGALAVVVADDVHGGGSVRATIRALRDEGVRVDDVLTLANFSGRRVIESAVVTALIERRPGVWEADACPLCAAGSRALPARAAWEDLVASSRE